MSHIRLYDLFRKELHLPDDKASDFVNELREIVKLEADRNKQLIVTKNDIALLEDKIHNLNMKILKSRAHMFKILTILIIVAQYLVIFIGVLALYSFRR